MNKENVGFLLDNLKYLGFGESPLLIQQLKDKISTEAKEFELYTENFYDDLTKMEAKLFFRKSDAKERYIFYRYDALLRYQDEPDKNKAQSFYIFKGLGITFKEAFNLLHGRSVNKDMINLEGEKYNAWVQLNFEEKDSHDNFKVKQYREQYRFDLEKVLERYPIREMQSDETKAILIRSLRRGNLQLVTFIKTNKTEKMFIEANPAYKTINIFSLASRAVRRNGGGDLLPVQEVPVMEVPDPIRDNNPEEEEEPVEDTAIAGQAGEKRRPKKVHS